MCTDQGSYGSQHISVVVCVEWILWEGGRGAYVHDVCLSGYHGAGGGGGGGT